MCSNHQTRLEWSEAPCNAIITAVSALADVPAGELPPLYDYVDPDALNALFAASDDGSDLRLSFSYLEYDVTVHQEGETVITVVNRDASVRCSQSMEEW
ncbi:HalOD1 output domain-containing protein [Natronococcus wangiae]|uniref:HalOD1 output domain-containing protein n=1 Tax=Natronococcus wangiae TaxID=3068275 RepID=UPI0027401566|nr:HalOD1 output domain-containing protein [Natronococcus sp. AD5]